MVGNKCKSSNHYANNGNSCKRDQKAMKKKLSTKLRAIS